MRRRSGRAVAITPLGLVVAVAWLWVGPGSYQPFRPAPPWDDLAAWILLLAIAISVCAIVRRRNPDLRERI